MQSVLEGADGFRRITAAQRGIAARKARRPGALRPAPVRTAAGARQPTGQQPRLAGGACVGPGRHADKAQAAALLRSPA